MRQGKTRAGRLGINPDMPYFCRKSFFITIKGNHDNRSVERFESQSVGTEEVSLTTITEKRSLEIWKINRRNPSSGMTRIMLKA